MSPAEMEWYCSTFNIMDEKAARPKFLKEVIPVVLTLND